MDSSPRGTALETRTTFPIAAALAVWWIGSTVSYTRLPSLMPMHFTLGGAADGPLRPAGAAWFLFPGIASFTFIVLEFSLRMAATNPSLLNIPHKDAYLRLEARERAPILRELYVMAALIILCTGVALAAIQVGVYQVAQQASAQLPLGPQLVAGAAFIALPLAVLRGYLRINSRLSALVER